MKRKILLLVACLGMFLVSSVISITDASAKPSDVSDCSGDIIGPWQWKQKVYAYCCWQTPAWVLYPLTLCDVDEYGSCYINDCDEENPACITVLVSVPEE